MNRSLIMAFAAVAAMTASARQLTPEQALSRALGSNSSRTMAVGEAAAPRLAFTATDSSERPMAYVFTQADNQGYMVVSADDVAVPMLAYADNGTFDAGNIPENMRHWLEGYASEIAWAVEHNDGSSLVNRAVSRAERAPIAPMVTTKWNQDGPYNNLCPKESGKLTMTGCVATAMAQVLNYHKYPAKGQGTHTYTMTNGNQVSFNFGGTTFDWENMADTYSSESTDAQNTAVATLMRACGVATDMEYGVASSGTPGLRVPYGLVTYFGYDAGAAYLDRNWYTLSEWEDIVYNELATVGPVIYGGASLGGGHEFVCDGYSSDGYFHINWGWGGVSDGYFRLSALDPAYQGIGGTTSGYYYIQSIVSGVQPPKDNTPRSFMTSQRSFRVGGGSAMPEDPEKYSTIRGNYGRSVFGGAFFNMSYNTIYPGSMGLQLVDAATGQVKTTLTSTVKGGSWTGITWKSANGYGMGGPGQFEVKIPTVVENPIVTDGDYIVYPVWRQGDGEWTRVLPYGPEMTTYMYMTVNGSQVVYNPPSPGSINIEFDTPTIYANNYFTVKVKVTNPGETEYVWPIYASLLSGKDILAWGGGKLVNLAPGETKEIEYEGRFTGVNNGSYRFAFLDWTGTGNVRVINDIRVPVVIKAAPDMRYSNFKIVGNAGAVDRNNIKATIDVECVSGEFTNPMSMWVTVSGSAAILATLNSEMAHLSAGQKATVTITGAFPAAETGVQYTLYPVVANKQIQNATDGINAIGIRFAESTGIDEVEAAEEDAPAQYFNLQGMPVNPDNLRPGQIYIRRSGTTATKIRY